MPWVGKLAFIGLWIAVLVGSAFLPPSGHVGGLLVTLLGGTALTLTAFTLDEARVALRTSAVFWEATARNAWMAGVLGSVLNFVLALGTAGAPAEGVLRRLGLAFVPAIYGLALAGLCSVPAVRLRQRAATRGDGGGPGSRLDRALGPALFLALVVFTMWVHRRATAVPPLQPWNLIVHWPAVLVVLGAALGFRVLAGGEIARRLGSPVFAVAGTLGCLMGVVSVLLAIAEPDIGRLTGAVSFILTAAFVALLAMALVANPAEDRRVAAGEAPDYSWASRAAWLLFPLAALIFLFVAFLVVTTPFPMKG
jgi:MotA/TolQ/ExbB proton channel family protein